jgi:hypothetical protein
MKVIIQKCDSCAWKEMCLLFIRVVWKYTIVKAVYYSRRFIEMDGAGGYSGTAEEGAGGSQRNVQNQAAQKRFQQTQAKVDEVLGLLM